MTTEDWVICTFLSYGLGIILKHVEGGHGRWCAFSIGNYDSYPHDIIMFLLGYKIHNMPVFAAWNLLVTDMFAVQ